VIKFRLAELQDLDTLFNWANDNSVRENSYNPQVIEYGQHINWFNEKINSDRCVIYIFTNDQNTPIGYVRIEKEVEEREALIGIAIDTGKRGKGFGTEMLQIASSDFLQKNPGYYILAFIMKKNAPSYKTFIKAGYKILREETYKNIPSLILHKGNDV